MPRSCRTPAIVVGLLLVAACGESTTQVTVEATETMLCVKPVNSSLSRLRVSSPSLNPELILTDTEGEVAFNPPWTGDVRGELDSLRCYNFLNFHPQRPREFAVSVQAGGVTTELVVPRAEALDELSLFGGPMDCSEVREFRLNSTQMRETWAVVEVPPGSLFTYTYCERYVIMDGEKVPIEDVYCNSWFTQDQGGGRAELMCEQERTEPDGTVEGPGTEAFYFRFDE